MKNLTRETKQEWRQYESRSIRWRHHMTELSEVVVVQAVATINFQQAHRHLHRNYTAW